jgi:hypothetical protein
MEDAALVGVGDVNTDADGGDGTTTKWCSFMRGPRMRAAGACIMSSLRVLAIVFTVLLFVGAVYEALGYADYQPHGTFVAVTMQPGGQTIRVLAQCVTPDDYVPGTYPTMWSEVRW